MLIFLLGTIFAGAQDVYLESGSKEVFFFYSETCPHCQAELKFLKDLEAECGDIKIYYLLSAENEVLLEEKAAQYDTLTTAVPRTFVGDKAYIGFSPDNGPLEYSEIYKAHIGYENQIKSAILNLSKHDHQKCNDDVKDVPKLGVIHYIVFLFILIYGLSFFIFHKKFRTNKQFQRYWISFFVLIIIIGLFFFIKSFSEVAIKDFALSLPFPLFTFIIALADGFNPCAFTVLIILLSLLTYTKRRKDMMTIGLTFIITSAIMYFIFIMVMVFLGSWAMEKYSSTIMLVLGLGIGAAGLINMKDFFFFKKGISLSISDKDKMTFTKKARSIVNKLKDSNDLKSFTIAVFGTILLGIFVNLIELGCTAILPAIYMTSLINTMGTTLTINHIFWTAFYSIVYILPLLAILLNFIYSFKSTRLTEVQGRKLKFISGIIMIVFGLIMIFMPNILIFH